jgi:hypothetical protein
MELPISIISIHWLNMLLLRRKDEQGGCRGRGVLQCGTLFRFLYTFWRMDFRYIDALKRRAVLIHIFPGSGVYEM